MRSACSLWLVLACVIVLSTSVASASPARPQRAMLTVHVVKDGDGTGFVSTTVGACRRSSCSFPLRAGTRVSLTARPGAKSRLGAWSGACSGTRMRCSVAVRGRQTVTARFAVSAAIATQRRAKVSKYVTSLPPLVGEPEQRVKTGAEQIEDIFVPDSSVPAGQVRYHCTTQPYKLTKNPEKIVTLNPDAGKLWLGALLQGDGYQGGLGSLKELPISKRAPLTIFADVLDPSAQRTIEHPTAASVHAAIAQMVRSMDKEGFPFPTVALFRQTTASKIDQGLLDLGFSAHYLGFKVEGGLNIQHKTEESSLIASLEQRYFTVSIVTPDTPGGFFDLNSFTAEDLKAQQGLGRIGPHNPPVVVSSISYGRSFILSVTAKTTDDRLSAALKVAFSGLHGDASLSLTTEQKKILSEARIEVISNGGGEEAFREAVKAGSIKPVLDRPSTLSTAVPISFQVDNLGDGSAAKFAETSEYNQRTCKPVDADTIVVGEIGKLSNVVVHSSGACSASLYGSVIVNGNQVWQHDRGFFADGPVVPQYGSLALDTKGKWPVFVPPEVAPLRLDPPTWSNDEKALYLTRITDSRFGAADPQFHVTGALTKWAWLGGEATNAFDDYIPGPFNDREVPLRATSPRCPLELIVTITHVAYLTAVVA